MGCASSCCQDSRNRVQSVRFSTATADYSRDEGSTRLRTLPSLFPWRRSSSIRSREGTQASFKSRGTCRSDGEEQRHSAESSSDLALGPTLAPLTTKRGTADSTAEPKTPAFGLLGRPSQPPVSSFAVPGCTDEDDEAGHLGALPGEIGYHHRTSDGSRAPSQRTVNISMKRKTSKFFERIPTRDWVPPRDSNTSTPPQARESTGSDDGGFNQFGALSEFGSLTGWQRIAAGIMNGDGVDDEDDGDGGRSQTSYTSADYEAMDLIPPALLASIVPGRGESFYSDYEILEELGQGAYGKAFRAQRHADGEVVVAKMIDTSAMSKREKAETKQEIKVLAHMDHPSIVKYLAAYAEDKEIIIVMEYCAEGDLTRFLKKRKGKVLEEHQIMLRFVQVCLALHHVHEKGILHRDLKASNIFCDTHAIVKLGDFGISKMLGAETNTRTIVGTPYYLSPEICEDKPYGIKSDIWSLGCVLYELCTLRHAFDGKSLPQLVLKILAGKFPPIADHYSDNLKKLVKSLLVRNPEDRPDLVDIFKSSYVQGHLKRYVVHIKKHVMKRKDSFKRSVAAWDGNDNSDSPEGGPNDNIDQGQSWRSGTIEKRRNSTDRGDLSDLSDDKSEPLIPRGTSARQLREDQEGDMAGFTPPPRRQKTATANMLVGKVSFNLPDKKKKKSWMPGNDESTTSDSDDDCCDLGESSTITDMDLNQALGPQGFALLNAGLPGTRFGGDSTPETPVPTPTAGFVQESNPPEGDGLGIQGDHGNTPDAGTKLPKAKRPGVRFSDPGNEVQLEDPPSVSAPADGLLGALQLPASNWNG